MAPVATVVLQQQPEGIAGARVGLAAKGEKGGQGARAEIPAPDTAANKENTGAATQTLGPFMERRDSGLMVYLQRLLIPLIPRYQNVQIEE